MQEKLGRPGRFGDVMIYLSATISTHKGPGIRLALPSLCGTCTSPTPQINHPSPNFT